MLAAVAERYGSADVIKVRDVPPPVAGKGQLRVRVRASSLNPLDIKLRSGSLRPFLRLRFPAVLGFDLAGDVESVGPEAAGFSVDDRVYGRTDRLTGGAHAQLAVVSARVLDRIPERLSYEHAGALPLVGMTALQDLRDIARLRAGQRLLVVGGTGGVGSHAVQIGRVLGATVAAVVSTHGAALAHRLGATEIVDHTRGELERLDRRFDVIFDTAFTRPFRVFDRLLGRGGVYVTTGFSPNLVLRSLWERLASGRRLAWAISTADGPRMRALSELVSVGQLEPVIDSVWPLDRIRDAYRKLEAGGVLGKVVIAIP